MTKALEHSSPYINLTLSQVQKYINSLGKDLKVEHYNLASSGLANTNYIITLENGTKVVLRIHSNGSFDTGKKEKRLSNMLEDIPEVAKVLYFEPKSDDNTSCSIIEFIEGNPLSEINTKKSIENVYYEVGVMLAKLKDIKFASPGLLDDNLEIIPITTKHTEYYCVTNFVLDCLENDNLISRVNTGLVGSIRDLVIKNNSLLLTTAEECHLVHGDFKVENIMAKLSTDDPKIHLSGVLDWEHARADTSYGDIATLFRGDYTKNSANKLSFYDGYTKSGARLISDWDKVCKIIDLVNICDFLCSNNDRPKLFEVMIKNIESTISYCK